MAFLDNSGDIILDAVLTDLGRQRMAAGNFRISKFALGDEEINYKLFNGAPPSGSAFSDLEIMQTPILEAFTSDQSLMKTRLLSFARTGFLYMPILKINNKAANVACSASTDISGFHLVADNRTLTNADAASANTALPNGFINGLTDSSAVTTHICIDQGIDSGANGLNPGMDMDPSFLETAFIVKVDHRLLRLQAYTGTNSYRTLINQFVDDDAVASYYITQGQEGSPILGPRSELLRNRHLITPTNPDNAQHAEDYEMFGGPLGSVLRITPRVSTSVQQSTSLFTELGTAAGGLANYRGGNLGAHKFIDTIMNVTGVTTGYSIDVPIRIIKKD